jgi:protein-S-isoprenylcysteine O-methyltransferase Ste14
MTGLHSQAYRFRGVLMIPPCLFAAGVSFRETEWDALVWLLGVAVFLAGVGIRIWAQTHLHYRLRVHKALTTTGPYARVRNPIYIANTLMLLGLTFMSELVWFLPIMLLWCIAVYGLVIRQEEAHLLEKYGEPYAAYLRRVPRWRPARKHGGSAKVRTRGFLWPSVVAELHCFLWILPFIGKEILSEMM